MSTTIQGSNFSSSQLAAINGTSSSSSAASTSATDAAIGSTTDAQNRFLKLLVTQLQNQDPLNPMDNAQVTSQLAQISTVDGISQLNTTLQTLLSSSTDSATLQAASLVGHDVLVPGKNLNLSNGSTQAGVDLSGAADAVTVTIKNASGLTVRTLNLGAMQAGTHAFTWDGKADNGSSAASGSYTMSIAATQGGSSVGATALQYTTVNSVARSSAGVSLNVNQLGSVSLGAIKQIL